MKSLVLVLAVVLVGCGKSKPKPEPLTKEESAKVIEAAIRAEINKPTGELTKAGLEKVTELNLADNQLTSLKGLEQLTQLEHLCLAQFESTLTKAQIAELQKSLPKCDIHSKFQGVIPRPSKARP